MGKKDDDIILEEGCPLWMMTLGDCMSLLVTFFVLLLSFSTPNSDQLMDAIEGMKGALSVMKLGNTAAPTAQKNKSSSNSTVKVDSFQDGGQSDSRVSDDELAVVNLQSVKIANRFSQFKERLLEIGFHKFVRTEQMDQGIAIKVPFDQIFDKGTTQVTVQCFKFLESFANLAGSLGNEVQLVAEFPSSSEMRDDCHGWVLPRKRIFKIGSILRRKYRIRPNRFSYGYKIIADEQTPSMTMILAEKLGVSRVGIKELLNFSQEL